MKKNIIPAFLLLLFYSCSGEPEDPTTDGGNTAPQTRGYIEIDVTEENTDTDEPGDDLKTIRFIVFSDLYTYPKVDTMYYEKIADSNKAASLNVVLGVSRTDKLVVAIANEPEVLRDTLDNIKTLRDLENLELKMAHYVNNDHLSLKDRVMMPMSGAVWVKKDNIRPTIDDAKAHRVRMSLERVLARVDVYMATEIPVDVELVGGSKITLKNTFTRSYFVRHDTVSAHGYSELGYIQTVTPPERYVEKYWEISEESGGSFVGGEPPVFDKPDEFKHVCSFYTPERSCLTEKLTLDFALKAKINGKTEEKVTSIVLKEATNDKSDTQPIDTIRRNNRYVVQLNIGKANIIEGKIKVMKWEEGLYPFPVKQYYLILSKSLVEFPHTGGMEVVTVKTNYPDNWKISDSGLPGGITHLTQEDKNTIEIHARKREKNEPVTDGWFAIKAGNLSKTIRVTQEEWK